MGNKCCTKKYERTDFVHKLLSKLKKSRNCKDFIVEYNKLNKNKLDDISLYDCRRTVFVSLVGLYRTWMKCPSIILHSSLFVFPIKKEWIYSSNRFLPQILTGHEDENEMKLFIKLLQWKDSHGLLFCMKDDIDYDQYDSQNELVSPFWRLFSSKLTDLYDPVTQNNYKPLQFDEKWWTNDNHLSLYNVKASAILSELYFNPMRYAGICEIIYKSNPSSLNPIISYNECYTNNTKPVYNNKFISVSNIMDLDETTQEIKTNPVIDMNDDKWFVSIDYFNDNDTACDEK